jgi:argininosuccinate lyase
VFAPEYVAIVLNENFEDAKAQFLSPLMAIHHAHLVMLAERQIVSAADARAIRDALDSSSPGEIRDVRYDGTCEDLYFYVDRLIARGCGADAAAGLRIR